MSLSGTARNIAFAHNDWVEKAATVLTGASWRPSLPLTNLKTLKLSEIARSIAPNALDPHILVDFGETVRPPVSGILIPRHNLSDTARWRFRLGSDPAMPPAATEYDTRPLLGTTSTLALLPVSAAATYTVKVADNISFSNGVGVRLRATEAPDDAVMSGTVYSYNHLTRDLVFASDEAHGAGVYGSWIVERLDADIKCWPEVRALGDGVWGDDYTWGGTLAVGEEYRPPAVHLIPLASGITDPFYPRYARIDFSDIHNPAGVIDLSKLVIAAIWQPWKNLAWGWELEPVDPSVRVRSRGGVVYVDPRKGFRRLTLTLDELTRREAYSQAYEMQKRLGIRRPAIVVVEPDQAIDLHRLTLFCSLVRTAPIRNPHIDSYSVQLVFEDFL